LRFTRFLCAGVTIVGTFAAVAVFQYFIPALVKLGAEIATRPPALVIVPAALLVLWAMAIAAAAVPLGFIIVAARVTQLKVALRDALRLALRLVVANGQIVGARAPAAAVVRTAVSAVALGCAGRGIAFDVAAGRVGVGCIAADSLGRRNRVLGHGFAGAAAGSGYEQRRKEEAE